MYAPSTHFRTERGFFGKNLTLRALLKGFDINFENFGLVVDSVRHVVQLSHQVGEGVHQLVVFWVPAVKVEDGVFTAGQVRPLSDFAVDGQGSWRSSWPL